MKKETLFSPPPSPKQKETLRTMSSPGVLYLVPYFLTDKSNGTLAPLRKRLSIQKDFQDWRAGNLKMRSVEREERMRSGRSGESGARACGGRTIQPDRLDAPTRNWTSRSDHSEFDKIVKAMTWYLLCGGNEFVSTLRHSGKHCQCTRNDFESSNISQIQHCTDEALQAETVS